MSIDNSLLPHVSIPDEVLQLFYRITVWSESDRISKSKIKLKGWKNAIKGQNIIKCIKFKEVSEIPHQSNIVNNTLYVPSYSSSRYVLRQLRNVYCHNALKYENQSNQIMITRNDHVKICGSLSIEALKELIEHLLII